MQSLALAAYTSVVDNADNPANSGVNEALSQFSGRPDVTAIRRFAMAFLNADVAALDSSLDEIEGTFKHCEILRLLRHYETLLKRKLFLK